MNDLVLCIIKTQYLGQKGAHCIIYLNSKYKPTMGITFMCSLLSDCKRNCDDFRKQAISAHERALCQLAVCFELQSRRDRLEKDTKVALWKWYLEGK